MLLWLQRVPVAAALLVLTLELATRRLVVQAVQASLRHDAAVPSPFPKYSGAAAVWAVLGCLRLLTAEVFRVINSVVQLMDLGDALARVEEEYG